MPILVGLLLLAGCLGDEAADPGSPEGPAPEPSPSEPRVSRNATGVSEPVLTFDGNFTLNLTGGAAGMSQVAPGNCLRLRPGAFIVDGNLTATWTAQSLASQNLEVVLDVAGVYSATGPLPSPIIVSLAPLEPSPDADTVFAVQPTTPGAAIQQAVQVHLRFTYTGAVEFQDAAASCNYG